MAKPKFTPFKVPVIADSIDENGREIKGDTPLVVPAGTKGYLCSGCQTLIPTSGFWVTETVEDGLIVGLSMRVGSDGPVVHACGKGS